jgi:6-pyruvoyl-tetrahydropterin synthase
MGVTEDLADALAKDAIEAAETLGAEMLIDQIAKSLGDSSTTTQEAFLTAVRVRQAEKRARRLLNSKIEAALKAQPGND